MLKIGELATLSGLNASKIRYFEKQGLLTVGQRQANGYRVYPDDTLDLLNIIIQAQEVGFSLNELKGLLPNFRDKGESHHGALIEALEDKLKSLSQVQSKIEENKASINAILSTLKADSLGDDCIENARQLLNSMPHHVLI